MIILTLFVITSVAMAVNSHAHRQSDFDWLEAYLRTELGYGNPTYQRNRNIFFKLSEELMKNKAVVFLAARLKN